MPPRPYRNRFRRIHLGRPWCEALELEGGRQLLMRPIRPDDAERLQVAFKTLTPEEVRFRFFHPIKQLSPEFARSLTSLDPDQAFALVITECLPPEQARIGAVGRVGVDPVDGAGQRHAEFAVTVGAELRGFGLARHLLQRLTEWCRKRRLDSIYGRILSENHTMLHLAEQLGFRRCPETDSPGVVIVRRSLSSAQQRLASASRRPDPR
jgi:RimJ/RimL family protein N-acetyltransferase